MPTNSREYARAYYLANRERLSEREKARRAWDTPAFRERRRAKATPETRAAQAAYYRSWRAADPWAKARTAWRASRVTAREHGTPVGAVTKEDFARLHLLPCVYCGVTPSFGVDHVVPFIRGGTNEIDNLAPACFSCNCRKKEFPASKMAMVGGL